MELITFIHENWSALLGIAAFGVSVICAIHTFGRMPRSEQINAVKQWLRGAVKQAEEELGGGTGPMKLRRVYDWFLQRFPAAALFITFDQFSNMVDEALDWMDEYLAEQKQETAHE